jgi:hypothetical protein
MTHNSKTWRLGKIIETKIFKTLESNTASKLVASRSSLFWDIACRRLVAGCQHFGTTYQTHLDPWRCNRYLTLSQNIGNKLPTYVTQQPKTNYIAAKAWKEHQLTTHLKYNPSDHNPELQQQVVSCWVECGQVDKSQVVIQAVEESRNKVQHHNCQKGKECLKMLFIHSEICLNENSDPIPSGQLRLRKHTECFRNFHLHLSCRL